MVGVPGRSKACNTCKKRRIKCGLQTPNCEQCIKAKLNCGGYQRERIFIVTQDPSDVSQYRAKKPRKKLKSESQSDSTFATGLSSSRSTSPDDLQLAQAGYKKSNIIDFQTISPCPSYRQQIFDAFVRGNVPDWCRTGFDQPPWFLLLPEPSSQTKALEISMMALASARLGRANKDPSLLKQSMTLYGQGLTELRKALLDPLLMYLDDTLGACMALAMYELCECPFGNRVGYVNHHDGCAQLVRLRGPKAHTKGLGHNIFLTFRKQAALRSLESHYPSFLMNDEWRKIPWSESRKAVPEKLLDILGMAPGIFCIVDTLKDLSHDKLLPTLLDVVSQCWQLDAQLKAFYEELEESVSGPLYWPKFAKDSIEAEAPSGDKVFPVAYHFQNLMMAGTVMLYWATVTMLWSGLAHLYDSLRENAPEMVHDSKHAPSSHQLPSLDNRVDFIATGRNVCQSVEYCMQDGMFLLGPTAVAAPLAIVVGTLKDRPEFSAELEWAHRAIKKVHSRGLRMVDATI